MSNFSKKKKTFLTIGIQKLESVLNTIACTCTINFLKSKITIWKMLFKIKGKSSTFLLLRKIITLMIFFFVNSNFFCPNFESFLIEVIIYDFVNTKK